MNAQDLRRGLAGASRPWLVLLAMLALPLALPDSGRLRTLRGRPLPREDAGPEGARVAAGYYEDLIGPVGEDGRDAPAPPPGWEPFAVAQLLEDVPDYRRQRLRPNLEYRWNGATLRTNRLGYRGPEVEPAKPPGTFRVVLLGSSNTLGQGVDDGAIFARHLEAWLAARRPPGCRAEVVNLAVSSDSPTQQWARLRAEVAGLEPDWIFCDVTPLDFALEEIHLRWLVGSGLEIPPELGFVREALAEAGASPGDSPATFHEKLGDSARPIFARTCALWAAEARRIGVPLTVLVLPWPDARPSDGRSFAFFLDQARQQGLSRLDLSGCLDAAGPENCRVAPWDAHPNAEGHRLIAEALCTGLAADPEFAARLGRP